MAALWRRSFGRGAHEMAEFLCVSDRFYGRKDDPAFGAKGREPSGDLVRVGKYSMRKGLSGKASQARRDPSNDRCLEAIALEGYRGHHDLAPIVLEQTR
jgi:hypothetical protein